MSSLRQSIETLVLIPVGPKESLAHVVDTVESVFYHLDPAQTRVCLLDDTSANALSAQFSGIENVFCVPALRFAREKHRGRGYWPLFANEIHALKAACGKFDFEVLLKVDVDALLTNDGLIEEVKTYFATHPKVAMVGAHRTRGDGSSKGNAVRNKGRELMCDMSWRNALQPDNRILKQLVKLAQSHNYELGDTVTGGAYATPGVAAREIVEKLPYEKLLLLRYGRLGEDSLVALCLCALGYQLGEMPDNGGGFCINWRGLPLPEDEVVARGKKVIHPVRDHSDPEVEKRVRAYFAARRASHPQDASQAH